MREEVATFSERLKQAMKERNLRAVDLVELTNISKGRISQYVNGTYEAKPKAIYALSIALNVEQAWLVGYDVPMEPNNSNSNYQQHKGSATATHNIPQTTSIASTDLPEAVLVQLPMLGEISCGVPQLAMESWETYPVLMMKNNESQADFCLRAKGDSMIGAGIKEGDVVLVRKQEVVEDGQIAVVIVGEEDATLKRVYYNKERGELSLIPENPNYLPMHFSGEELNQIHILGRAIQVVHDL